MLYVACRDHMLVQVGLDDIPTGLRELSISSIELQVPKELTLSLKIEGRDRLFRLTNTEDLRALRKSLEKHGVLICALLLKNNFGAQELADEIKYTVEACRAAEALGVRIVRIDPAVGDRLNIPLREQAELAARPIREVIGTIKGVELAAENHGLVANTREFLETLFERVGSERLGLTLDPGNLYWYGLRASEVYEMVDIFAHRVKHTHMKNCRAPYGQREARRQPGQVEMTPLYEGDIDHGMVVAILEKTGYEGDLTVEDESLANYRPEEGRTILKRDVNYLRSLID